LPKKRLFGLVVAIIVVVALVLSWGTLYVLKRQKQENLMTLRTLRELPSTSQLQLPNPAQLRVPIIRLQGASTDQSERIKSILVDAGYTNITTDVRS